MVLAKLNGLCFSVENGVLMPPSLKNIFKEIKSDIGKDFPENGNLERWAKQGILLLNSVLTVRANTPGSHKDLGWEKFTSAVIKKISELKTNIVFILWGAYAFKKGENIDNNKPLNIEIPTPFTLFCE